MGAASAFARSLTLLAICAVTLAGCGDSETSFVYDPPKAGREAPPANLFPDPAGQSLRQLLKAADVPIGALGLRVEPTAMVFDKGQNRYPVVVVASDGTPVDSVDVALYLARVPAPRSGNADPGAQRGPRKASGLDSPAQGPFPARVETLATAPPFTAQSTEENPGSATVVYVSALDFPSEGDWRVAAVIRDGGESASVILPTVAVGEFKRFPKVGQPAPLIHTPTAAPADGGPGSLSTRRPATSLNQVDFADALGREPVILAFASPEFSSNHTAGPTLDVVEQLNHRFGEQAAFINVEIYNNNDPAQGVQPQVRAYRLPTEPWVFAIDRQGRIVGEVEGPAGVSELTRVVERAIRGSAG